MSTPDQIKHFVAEIFIRSNFVNTLRDVGIEFKAGHIDYTADIITDELVQRISRDEHLVQGLAWSINRVHAHFNDILADASRHSWAK